MKQKVVIPTDVIIEPNVELSDDAHDALINFYTNCFEIDELIDEKALIEHFETSLDREHYGEVKQYIDALREEIAKLEKMGKVEWDFIEFKD